MVRILDSSEFSTWNESVRGNSFPESFVQTSLWPAERFFIVGETATSRTDATPTQTKANETIIAGCKVEERGLWMGKKVWLVRRSVNSQQPASTRSNPSRLESQSEADRGESTVNKIAEYLIGKAKEQGNVVMIRTQTPVDALPVTRYAFTKPAFLYHIEDPRRTVLVDLKFSEEELLKEMHEKTRYNIRLAEKKGVRVREGTIEEFYPLYEATNRRKGLKGFGKEYFNTVIARQVGAAKQSSNDLGKRENVNIGRSPHFVRDDLIIKIITAYYNNTPLASNLLVCFGKTVTYLFGGTADEYRELMAPHLLHWECMRWAKREGYEWYDWWGIESKETINKKQKTKKQDWEGITRFKRGFVSEKTGTEIDFGETQDLVVDQKWYRIFALVKKML